MLELHCHGANIFSLGPLIALHEKGVQFRSRLVRWTETQRAAAAFAPHLEAANNLEGELPLLVDGDAVIADCFFILEYLEDRFPSPALKPGTPHGDWQVQVWGRFLGERAAPAIATLGTTSFFAADSASADMREAIVAAAPSIERKRAWQSALAGECAQSLREESRRKAGLLLDRIENSLASDNEWLLGERYSLADIAAYAFARLLPTLVPELCNAQFRPATMRWLQRMLARPAVTRALQASDGVDAFVPGPEHARWG